MVMIRYTMVSVLTLSFICLVFKAGIHKMLVRIGKSEDPDLTDSSEAVWPQGYKTFFMPNSTEQEIYPSHKSF